MQMPNFSMEGRIALITGSGRGIGLGMAHALAAAGCAVAIQDIDLEVAQEEAEKIEQAGGRAIALGGDVTDLALAPRLVQQTVEQLGGLHVLINNAAIQIARPWDELTLEEIERQIRADQILPLLLCQQAAPIFKAQRWGRVINLGSIQQRGGASGMIAYSMSKAALVQMTGALARSLAEHRVTVNLIAPGYYDTWRNRSNFASEQEKVEKGRRWIPLGRLGQPEDCGGVALLLCSEAGEYITGQTIYVDGGMSA
jgi:NAD(P)-dependent dehydrogenase (short-subunit alcohol dehydrogenase family)